MVNLTLTIDEEILKRARIRALEHGTSVNAVVRDYLNDYAGALSAEQAVREVLEMTEHLDSGSGPDGRSWSREEIYDERLRR
ncbi:hypothetical protein BH20ACT4_BH20ACT4_00700 [soil metagenome]